ncbi:MAG: thermonuclease family protein [Nitrospiraceae bacterium]
MDGDTFAYNGHSIRIAGMDAPELGAPGGSDAAQHLAALLQTGRVTIMPQARDVYGRTVATVMLNGYNLAERMIAEGYARKD